MDSSDINRCSSGKSPNARKLRAALPRLALLSNEFTTVCHRYYLSAVQRIDKTRRLLTPPDSHVGHAPAIQALDVLFSLARCTWQHQRR